MKKNKGIPEPDSDRCRAGRAVWLYGPGRFRQDWNRRNEEHRSWPDPQAASALPIRLHLQPTEKEMRVYGHGARSVETKYVG